MWPAATVVPLVAVLAVMRGLTATLLVVSRTLPTIVPACVVAPVGEARFFTSVVAAGPLVIVSSTVASVAATVVASVVVGARPIIPPWTVELPIPSTAIISTALEPGALTPAALISTAPIVPAPAFVMTPIVVATPLVTTVASVAASIVASVVVGARPIIPPWTVELPIPSTAIISTALEPGALTPTAPVVPAPILGTARSAPVIAATALLLPVATATLTALAGVPALPESTAAVLSPTLVIVIGSTAGPATSLVASVGATITSKAATPVVGTGHRTS